MTLESDRNLTFAYELEAWWLAGCRHDQQQALSRWRDSKRMRVPIDCLQCSLGHGRIAAWGGASAPRFHFENSATIIGVSSGFSWYVATATTSQAANTASPINIGRPQA
jgi:hypothetical protein